MAIDDRPCNRTVRRRALCALAAVALALGAPAVAQTLAGKAKESGCVDAPRVVEGRTYRCNTSSGAAAYFNVPGAPDAPPSNGSDSNRTSGGNNTVAQGSPSSFPKVDPGTQRNRDDMRRKVLGDELASEEKLLAEARAAYGNGAPPALPDEQANPQKYAERIAKLRQAVQLHERNIEALRKEIGASR
jgi:hypothetical protein